MISNTAKESNILVYQYDNNEDTVEKVTQIMKKGDIILIKASNGMKFKQIVDKLVEK